MFHLIHMMVSDTLFKIFMLLGELIFSLIAWIFLKIVSDTCDRISLFIFCCYLADDIINGYFMKPNMTISNAQQKHAGIYRCTMCYLANLVQCTSSYNVEVKINGTGKYIMELYHQPPDVFIRWNTGFQLLKLSWKIEYLISSFLIVYRRITVKSRFHFMNIK